MEREMKVMPPGRENYKRKVRGQGFARLADVEKGALMEDQDVVSAIVHIG
jgi:hypothetical protein